MKNTNRNRLFGRHLARELTFEELKDVAGGVCDHTCTLDVATSEHDDDHIK